MHNKDVTTHDANLHILDIIKEYINTHPNMSFFKILKNLRLYGTHTIHDRTFEDSVYTLYLLERQND